MARSVRLSDSLEAKLFNSLNSLLNRNRRRDFNSSKKLPCFLAASACLSNGFSCLFTSRCISPSRSRFEPVESSRLSAFSFLFRNFNIPAASSIMERRSSSRAFRTASIWPCEMITCCCRPTPTSESNSWISSSLQGEPLSEYSLSPLLKRVLVIVISGKSKARLLSELSIVSETSALPRALLSVVPAKITSSIRCDLTALGACAPKTHATASTTLDLPLPFGPTTAVTPGSRSSVAESAKDLKPFIVRRFKNTYATIVSKQRLLVSFRKNFSFWLSKFKLEFHKKMSNGLCVLFFELVFCL